MVRVTFNGQAEAPLGVAEFRRAFERYDSISSFELWLNIEAGPAVCLLRNGEYAFLMYLAGEGEPGWVSSGAEKGPAVRYHLSNGQYDEYPRSWCVPLERAYQVMFCFFEQDGLRSDCIEWREGDEQTD